MCRLFSLTSRDPVSPIKAIEALEMMKEGHDGSGIGIFLSDLGGPFCDFAGLPILSGIFTQTGLRRQEDFMTGQGFLPRYRLILDVKEDPPPGTPKREIYLIQVYEPPEAWQDHYPEERERLMTRTRLNLRHMGQKNEDMVVFSFWPDVVMIKEVGDPMDIAGYLGLDREELFARRIMAQGRQNTNYGINLNACHPFFIQGIASMTGGGVFKRPGRGWLRRLPVGLGGIYPYSAFYLKGAGPGDRGLQAYNYPAAGLRPSGSSGPGLSCHSQTIMPEVDN